MVLVLVVGIGLKRVCGIRSISAPATRLKAVLVLVVGVGSKRACWIWPRSASTQTPESGVGVGCWYWFEAGLRDPVDQRSSNTSESGVGVGCWCWIEAGLLDLAAQRFNPNP